jgi:hypothetical protein
MKLTSKLFTAFLTPVLAIALLTPSLTFAQAKTTSTTPPAKAKAKTTTTAPTAKEIADAQAKGLVWVNTGSGIYHKDGQFYGNTKEGQFMTEADATKAGYRAAKQSATDKKKKTTTDTGSKKKS